jgi:hypothetical protein
MNAHLAIDARCGPAVSQAASGNGVESKRESWGATPFCARLCLSRKRVGNHECQCATAVILEDAECRRGVRRIPVFALLYVSIPSNVFEGARLHGLRKTPGVEGLYQGMASAVP